MKKDDFSEFDDKFYYEDDDIELDESTKKILDEYDSSKINQDEVREALRKIEELEAQEKAEQELLIQKYGYTKSDSSLSDDIDEVIREIQEERQIQEESMSKMTEEERLAYYSKICEDAKNYAKQHGVKTITVEELKNRKKED